MSIYEHAPVGDTVVIAYEDIQMSELVLSGNANGNLCFIDTKSSFFRSIFPDDFSVPEYGGYLVLVSYEVGMMRYRYCMNIDQDMTHDTCMYVRAGMSYVAMELYVCTYYVLHTGELEYVVVHGYWSTRSTFDIKQKTSRKKNVVCCLPHDSHESTDSCSR